MTHKSEQIARTRRRPSLKRKKPSPINKIYKDNEDNEKMRIIFHCARRKPSARLRRWRKNARAEPHPRPNRLTWRFGRAQSIPDTGDIEFKNRRGNRAENNSLRRIQKKKYISPNNAILLQFYVDIKKKTIFCLDWLTLICVGFFFFSRCFFFVGRFFYARKTTRKYLLR